LNDARGDLVPVDANEIALLVKKFSQSLRLVVLDTCYSLPQARMLAQSIPCAIGVSGAIPEPVATSFFALFYNGIGNGCSVSRAFILAHACELAKIQGSKDYREEVEDALESRFVAGRHLPVLVTRKNVDAEAEFLCSAPSR
jgi:hypothetical protein